MKHIQFFGFGYSAQALVRHLDPAQWRISGTSRTKVGAAAISAQGYEGAVFDELKEIAESVTHIVSSVPPDGEGDPVLRRFAAQLRARNIQWLAYLSTTGVYGDHAGAWIDEETALTPNTDRGHRRLVAERDWLNLHHAHGVPVHLFRLAGIYGPGRNHLRSVCAGSARRVIKPGQVFSRIHVDDIAGILLASMAHPYPGRAYNVADDEPCPPQDVVAYAAELLGKPIPADTPFDEAQLSPMARSFFADSKRVLNARVKAELGYTFTYPNYRVGLRALRDNLNA
jgi:nucleoside-diphosphate-sugar epimerase